MAAHGVSALLLRRSVLTEKIARRGYHLSREYEVDPPEALLGPPREGTVADARIDDPVVVHADDTVREVASRFAWHTITAAPVVDRGDPRRLLGLITVDQLLDGRLRDLAEEHERDRHLGPGTRRPVAGRTPG